MSEKPIINAEGEATLPDRMTLALEGLVRELLEAAVAYTELREEYNAHPWEVDAVSVENKFMRLSEAVWELRRYYD